MTTKKPRKPSIASLLKSAYDDFREERMSDHKANPDMYENPDHADRGEAEGELLAALVWGGEVLPQEARKFAVTHFGYVPAPVNEATRSEVAR